MALENSNEQVEKPTLKTISKLSGLAVPTVSRALNDAPDIGEKTKKLVRKIANEIGYVPNRAGVRLRTGRTNVISLVMSTDHDNHTGRFISSVAGGLQDTPYHMIVTPYFPTQDPMQPVRYIVETGSADAIILNQISGDDPRVAYLMARKFPFVTHGRTNWAEKHAYYDFDNETYGFNAVNHLHERGRKHIALVGPPLKHSYGRHLLQGVTRAVEANGQTLTRITEVNSDTPGRKLHPYLLSFLKQNPEIDGIITASTNAATSATGAVEGTDRKLGIDTDVYTKEASPFLSLLRPEILVCPEVIGDAGAFLAKAAIQAIRDPDAQPLQKLEVPKAP